MTMENLAIDGGIPVRDGDWAPWPWFDDEMVDATAKVLRSGKVNYWTGEVHQLADGTKVRGENGLFEYEFAKYHNSPHAIALGNGTLALELALQAFGVGAGAEVIVTSRTFIASASACVMRGAKPVFADIDLDSQNITAETVAPLITEKTRAVIAVHLAGWACEMDSLRELLNQAEERYCHKIYLIEDCAQCLGGSYRGRKLGSIGDAGCFSFCQDKIITTGGEGGMLLLNDDEAYRRAWSFKDHGKDFDKYNLGLDHSLVDHEKAAESSYYSFLGTNWRLTEMQAALGRVAMSKLDDWNLAKRKKYAAILNGELSKVEGIRVPLPADHIDHPYYKFYAFVENDKLADGWNRDRIMKAIAAEGVICQFGSTWGIGCEDGWKDVEVVTGQHWNLKLEAPLPNDHALGTTALMFQVHPTLDEAHIYDTVKAVTKVMAVACR